MAWEMSHKLYMKYQYKSALISRVKNPENFLWFRFVEKYPQYKGNVNWYFAKEHKAIALSSKYDWVNDKPTDEYLIKMASEKI
jgi:hypothetical protein